MSVCHFNDASLRMNKFKDKITVYLFYNVNDIRILFLHKCITEKHSFETKTKKAMTNFAKLSRSHV